MDKVIDTGSGIAVALIGLAIVAVLVSQKAATGQVVSNIGSAFAGIISAATAPITGTTLPSPSAPSYGNSGSNPLSYLGGAAGNPFGI